MALCHIPEILHIASYNANWLPIVFGFLDLLLKCSFKNVPRNSEVQYYEWDVRTWFYIVLYVNGRFMLLITPSDLLIIPSDILIIPSDLLVENFSKLKSNLGKPIICFPFCSHYLHWFSDHIRRRTHADVSNFVILLPWESHKHVYIPWHLRIFTASH